MSDPTASADPNPFSAEAMQTAAAVPESVPEAVEPAIRTWNLTKFYGRNPALYDVSVDVPVGSVCGLVGPNGAGKSTFMSMIATLLKPSAGAATVFGVDIADVSGVRPLIGHVPDVLGMYSGLTVEEYLLFFADAYRIPQDGRSDLVGALLELVDLSTKRDADVNTLSRGMKQRLGLARGLVNEPKLLLLDEPASGLDPRARVELREIILQLQRTGVTVLISSHILAELEEMCSHVLIIEAGRMVALEDLAAVEMRTVTVRFLDGTVESHGVVDDSAQAALVRSFVETGRDVVSVAVETTTLERRFMDLTRGEVN